MKLRWTLPASWKATRGGLPREIRPGERATLWLRAKGLAGRLRDAGYTDTPKLKLLVADSGGEHTITFRLRVYEYPRLKDGG